ncbi:enoyl-CoA hydratase [Bacillus sp. AFS055030]|uniref:enoyl-CoA hydratase n=1 Tax=Bacillus sp. AFS055030 TaxID=2033507 RepID=UPI000BFC1B52|nr:enoyl-CoA hydratase [Bacillus sp. AFS055030]PGL71357.1 enoyl-CoA hydratase [Bacillus sp. AFS055030]
MSISNTAEHVLLRKEGRVATVVFNRPEVLNAMNEDTFRQFRDVLDEIASSDVDVVVLCGNGKGFSSGGDLKSMLSNPDESAFGPVMDLITDVVVKLYTLPKIVISAIHGPAAGIGLSFALGSDFVLAHESGVLAMNFIGIGLIPDGGAHYFLEKRLGEAKAKQLIWEGKKLNATQALEIGLIDEVISGDFEQKINERVKSILQKPVSAMIQTKQIYCNNNLASLKNVLLFEKEGQSAMRRTTDHHEGVQAFLQKRMPVFTGK